MLAISSLANSNGVPVIGNDFLVASIELIDDRTIRAWFTRPVTNATTNTNYAIVGPSPKTVILTQHEPDTRGVRVYLNGPLSVGQWTLQFVSGGAGTLLSDDNEQLSLPSETRVVFDLVDMSSQDPLGTGLVEGPVSKFVPTELRNKPWYSALIAGIESGDAIISDQARKAFDQYSISTASGKYLTTRAADKGIQKPEKVGMSDSAFRTLAIDAINNKLTNDAFLSVFEIMYGEDSVRGYVESCSAPFEVFDKASLDLTIDGNQQCQFVATWSDYKTPLRASAIELSSALNFFFKSNGIKAYSVEKRGKVKIYSKTKGIRSSITVTGGTLQPYVQFNSSVFGDTTPVQKQPLLWTLSNPSTGVVRFTPATTTFDFRNPVLKTGDYVTITGHNFPSALRGSWPITNVSCDFPSTPSWVEVNSSPYYWIGICSAPNGDIYAVAGNEGEGIFKQAGGTGAFVNIDNRNYGWYNICAAPNGDIYALASEISPYPGIYKQTGGTGAFVNIDDRDYAWYNICAAPNGDIYAVTPDIAGIYKQTGGTGAFVAVNSDPLYWYDICAAPNGDIYAVAANEGGGIYKQTGGIGVFDCINGNPYAWVSICAAPNGDIYAAAAGMGIYKQFFGTGFFVAADSNPYYWVNVCAAPNGDVYATAIGTGIFKQTGGTGAFVGINLTSDTWYDICVAPNGDVYVLSVGAGIFKLSSSGAIEHFEIASDYIVV